MIISLETQLVHMYWGTGFTALNCNVSGLWEDTGGTGHRTGTGNESSILPFILWVVIGSSVNKRIEYFYFIHFGFSVCSAKTTGGGGVTGDFRPHGRIQCSQPRQIICSKYFRGPSNSPKNPRTPRHTPSWGIHRVPALQPTADLKR